jgi:hypothetical protein
MLFAFAALLFPDTPFICVLKSQLAKAIAALLFLSAAGNLSAEDQTVEFKAQIAPYQQAKVQVEFEGKLKLNGDNKELKHIPLKAQAELQYLQRTASIGKQSPDLRLIREYQTAKADIRLHESDIANELRDDRRMICVQTGSKGTTIFSPRGPMTREELELVRVPGGGLVLETLIPQKTFKIGETWPVSDTSAARLLDLDSVSQHDLICTLDSVKDNVAIISLGGKLTGAIGGVSSDIELKGKLNYDIKQRTITWLTLAYKENREISHSQPGFEVVTKLRMVLAPIAAVASLSDKSLVGVPLEPTASQTLIELNSDSAGYQLVHDRRWSVLLERPDLTVLRFVDHGDLIAQCNITNPPSLPKGQQLSMDGFQEEVKRVLGKNFEEMVEATEETGDNGLRVLRVVVAGKVGELTIQWTYYHLSDDHGRRASFVFTLESNLQEKYAQIDRELLGNFQFIATKEPTPAETKSASTPATTSDKVR